MHRKPDGERRQLSLFAPRDPEPPANATATSQAAAVAIARVAGTIRQRILSWRATANETGRALEVSLQALTPRIRELVTLHDRTRPTSRGCAARVYIALRHDAGGPPRGA